MVVRCPARPWYHSAETLAIPQVRCYPCASLSRSTPHMAWTRGGTLLSACCRSRSSGRQQPRSSLPLLRRTGPSAGVQHNTTLDSPNHRQLCTTLACVVVDHVRRAQRDASWDEKSVAQPRRRIAGVWGRRSPFTLSLGRETLARPAWMDRGLAVQTARHHESLATACESIPAMLPLTIIPPAQLHALHRDRPPSYTRVAGAAAPSVRLRGTAAVCWSTPHARPANSPRHTAARSQNRLPDGLSICQTALPKRGPRATHGRRCSMNLGRCLRLI